ncbi:hypothetical protein CAPTEDRAFT_228459 [Capitella teleta]|uniref:Coiled-coil alpha-helical rod protein 1 n=1 Tax=Capitella teleta TaxID=283909 RepID=R7TPH7_CAPTE|nr:hypothetical protein CAPTEDRAFT_228459 [Capitella teleta]|eukprot:ELT93411.1 hypothetical protein CAPTEDRAFT_228459 [Capitella teleta]
MAANLNKPSDFKDVQLLPPSSFERCSEKSALDPWESLTKATGEVLKLRQENERLRNERILSVPVGEEIRARVEMHQSKAFTPPAPVPQPTYHQAPFHEGILNRQAAEIEQLTQKLNSTESGYQKQVAHLEHQLALKDISLGQKAAALENEVLMLRNQERELKEKFHRKDSEIELRRQEGERKLQERLDAAQYELVHQTEELRKKNAEEVNLLKSKYEGVQRELQHQLEELRKELTFKENEVEIERKSVAQLKTYLKENAEMTKSTETWMKQVEGLQDKILVLEEEKSRFNSTLDLLSVRLKSQQQVINLQEQQITEDKFVKIPNGDAQQCVLTRWRKKVYELSVKQQCSEMVYRDEVAKWNDKMWNLEERLKSAENSKQQLDLMLQDKKAELDIEKNRVTDLEKDVFHAQQVAIDLDDKEQEHLQVVMDLVKTADTLQEKFISLQTAFEQSVNKTKLHDQRLNFANGRLDLLKGQFARREALLSLERDNVDANIHEPAERDSDVVAQLQQELDHVTTERNSLNHQLQEDAEKLNMKIREIKAQTADEVVNLREQLQLLHERMDESTEKNSELHKKLEATQLENKNLSEYCAELKSTLVEKETSQDEERKIFVAQIEEDCRAVKRDLEQRLSDSKRDHAKAVVQLRQQQRQAEREKERVTTRTKLLEEEHQRQIAYLHQTLRALDQERNLLMTTIRQEGLLSKLKANRPAPVAVSFDDLELPRTSSEPLLTTLGCTTDDRVSCVSLDALSPRLTSIEDEEPLHSVIDDIKQLAAAIDVDAVESDDATDDSD